jgi:hypothetical protein
MRLVSCRLRSTPDQCEEPIKTAALRNAATEIVVSRQSIWRLFIELRKGDDLVFQNLKHESGIKFGVIHTPCLKTPVLIMLYEMVVGIAWKRQRVEPERIDGRICQCNELRRGRSQVGQIMAQNIVTDDMVEALAEGVESRQMCVDAAVDNQAWYLGVLGDSCKGEYPRFFWINLEVYRNTTPQNIGLSYVCDRIHTQDASCLVSSL